MGNSFYHLSSKSGVIFALIVSFISSGVSSGQIVTDKTPSPPRNQLHITFAPDEVVTQQSETYSCAAKTKETTDVQKALLGTLSADRKIKVTYVSADVSALAIVPIDGKILVFTNVMAADGSKYVADHYFWWSKGDQATYGQVDDEKDTPLTCTLVKTPHK